MNKNKLIIVLQAIIASLLVVIVFDLKKITTSTTHSSSKPITIHTDRNIDIAETCNAKIRNIEHSIQNIQLKDNQNIYQQNIQISLHRFVANELRYNPYLPINLLKDKANKIFYVSNFNYNIDLVDNVPENLNIQAVSDQEIILKNEYTISKNIHNKYIIIKFQFKKYTSAQEQFSNQIKNINFSIMHDLAKSYDQKIQTSSITQSTQEYVFDLNFRNLLLSLIFFITLLRLIAPRYLEKDLQYISKQLLDVNKIDLKKIKTKGTIIALAGNANNIIEKLDGALVSNKDVLKNYNNFIADSFHQLNTPLTSIVMNIELIEMISQGDEANEYLLNLKASAEILKIYSKELGYISGDPKEYFPTYLNASEMLKSKEQSYHVLATSINQSILLTIESNIHILINKDEFEILLDNNLLNILKTSKQKSKIEISLNKIDKSIFLIFSTNDYTWNATNDDIFSEYFRESASNRGNGTGLKLSKQICIKNSIGFEKLQEDSKNILKYTFYLT